MVFVFELVCYCDGMWLEIVYELKFNFKGDVNCIWLGIYKFDIVICVMLVNNEFFFILFDVKYCIDS